MPSYHVHLSYVGKGAQGGGAPGFQRYLARADLAEGFRRYVAREAEHGEAAHGKDDLVAYGEAGLPAWARDGAHFWQEAEQRERANGPVFWHLQVALPRELGSEEREALADDMREVMVGRYPHVWAIHEPEARDGSGFQPHIHLQFSSRREDVESGKSMEEWFRQAPRGMPKDASWFTKGRLYDVRAAVELMTNAALARAGIEAAVSARSFAARGLGRTPAVYGQATHTAMMQYRHELRESGRLALEQLATYEGWQAQAQKLLSLDRPYITDLCRDHVWRYDRSPVREQEREAAMQRAFAFASGQWRQRVQQPQQRQAPRLTGAHQVQRIQALLARQQEAPEAGSALHIRLFEEEERQRQRQAGLSW